MKKIPKLESTPTKIEYVIPSLFALMLSCFLTYLSAKNDSSLLGKTTLADVLLSISSTASMWIILHLIQTFVLLLVWSRSHSYYIDKLIIPFSSHIILLNTWSWLFFKFGREDLALIVMSLLFALSLWQMCVSFRIHLLAGLLMATYQLWLSLMAYLNIAIFLKSLAC